jgi:hypothetical protein
VAEERRRGRQVRNERFDETCTTCKKTAYQFTCRMAGHQKGGLMPMTVGDTCFSRKWNSLFVDICQFCEWHESIHVADRCLLQPTQFKGFTPT